MTEFHPVFKYKGISFPGSTGLKTIHEFNNFRDEFYERYIGKTDKQLKSKSVNCFMCLEVLHSGLLVLYSEAGEDNVIMTPSQQHRYLDILGIPNVSFEMHFRKWIEYILFLTTFDFLESDADNGVIFTNMPIKRCHYCDKDNAPLKCANCLVARYCDSTCQTAHWFKHRKACV